MFFLSLRASRREVVAVEASILGYWREQCIENATIDSHQTGGDVSGTATEMNNAYDTDGRTQNVDESELIARFDWKASEAR